MRLLVGFEVKNYRESKKTKRHRTVTVYFFHWKWEWTTLRPAIQPSLPLE